MIKRLVFCLFLFAPIFVFAQPKENNPYSRFGLGSPSSTAFANQLGMGGLTAAWSDPYHLNVENPASLAFLRSTAFETGLFAQRSQLKAGANKLTDWRGSLSHLALGFPLKSPINEVLDKQKSPYSYGMAFSLTPVTTLGYATSEKGVKAGVDTFVTNNTGSGGIYQFRWGSAVKKNNFSVGANIGYMFGKLNYESFTQITSDSLAGFLTDYTDNLSVHGFTWNLGAQYVQVLKKNKETGAPTETITYGFFGNTNRNLRVGGESLTRRARNRSESGVLTNGNVAVDTLSNNDFSGKKIKLPTEIAFGITYTKVNKLKIGLQYSLAQWSNYKNEARPETLKNASNISAGLEWTPNSQNFGSYSRRMKYRFGAYFKKDPRVVAGKQIDDLGVSIGLGMPITLPRQGTSFVNWSLELGKLGKSTPITETYARLTVGFTLNDNSWFFKRRFE
jgi:hypothetical protein